MHIRKARTLLAASAATALLSASAQGAGFAIIENSASGMGSAFASGGAAGEDASTLWFNPASMTLLSGQNAVAAAHLIVPKADFTNNGSTNADGTPLTGPNADGGKDAFVPNLYYTLQLAPELFAGVGINAPFGLGTKYDDVWVGRYHAVDTELTTVNINPAVAYRLNEQWSIGGGVSLQYVDVTLSSAIDFGAILYSPGADDGFVKLTGDNSDDLSFGWNAGVLFTPTADTRLSLAYRSAVRHHATGKANFTVPSGAALIASTGAFQDTKLHADVELPASASFSAFHRFNEDFDIMADLLWTQWSVFQELRIKFANPDQPDAVTTENYQDQWRVALGGRYRASEKLLLRMGIAFDQKAVKDKYYRTPRIPGNDRTWLSVGMGYRLTEYLGMDLGYSHLFVPDTPMENTYESSLSSINHTLKGDYDASVDIFSAQLTLNF